MKSYATGDQNEQEIQKALILAEEQCVYWKRREQRVRRGLEERMIRLAAFTHGLALMEGKSALAEAVNLRSSTLATASAQWLNHICTGLVRESGTLEAVLPDPSPLNRKRTSVGRCLYRFGQARRNHLRSRRVVHFLTVRLDTGQRRTA